MAIRRLEAFPQLYEWFYSQNQTPPSSGDQVASLVWSICRALCQDDENLLKEWSSALNRFFTETSEPYQIFCEAENKLASVGMDFMNLASEIAELAVRMEKGEEHFALLDHIAQCCDVAVFRFLAAWTALNCGKLDACIDHCEAVDEPFACIYTLLGQAQLELGLAHDAIESLKIAVELSPREVLTLFQLAKAYHVSEDFLQAWLTLERVDREIPGNAEVGAFFAMVALTEPHDEVHLQKAWQTMVAHFSATDISPYEIGLMLDLAFVLKSPEKFRYLLDKGPWNSLRMNREFMANVPWILKKLEDYGWKDLTEPFLACMTLPQ